MVVLSTYLALATGAAEAAAPPNVLVILADDLGFSDLGCYGGEIDTPHLDRLAGNGLRFTQGYNTARCWPTRGALLTGYYAQAIRRDALPGGKGGAGGTRPAWARLLSELLAPAGYRSYHSGKWHVDGDPRAQGFARSLDVMAAGQSNYFDAAGVIADGQPITAGDDFYTTSAIGDHAVKCLEEHATAHAGRPFFHYVPFTAPHFPLQAPPDLIAKYRDRYRDGWDAARQARHARLSQQGIVDGALPPPERRVGPPYQPGRQALERLGAGEADRPLPWVELTPEQQEFQITKMAIHAALVEAMDHQIGGILAQLEAMNAFANTFILFASDNGASAEILIRGEGHDPLAPPWIVHWPTGIFAKALADAAAPPAHEALWWCHEGNRAVRVGDWKLVAAKGTPWEFYDLARDRCETTDLTAAEPDRRRMPRSGRGRQDGHPTCRIVGEATEHHLRDDRRSARLPLVWPSAGAGP